MVYICHASECTSDTRKLHKIEKYPWMRDVKWVKWPTDLYSSNRWKRLIKRGGVDKEGKVIDNFVITKRTRLCSRHFDEKDINYWNIASSDPKYFAWNNWGRSSKPRPTSCIKKMDKCRPRPPGRPCIFGSEILLTEPTDVLVPDIGSETDYSSNDMTTQINVGSMAALQNEYIEQPQDHCYISSPATYCTVMCQTDLSMNDIYTLEEKVVQLTSQTKVNQSKTSTPPIVKQITESNEKVNFYTGIPCKEMMNGVYESIKDRLPGMTYWNQVRVEGPKSGLHRKSNVGVKRKLDPFAEFLMTLVRLRLDLPVMLLADLFNISKSTVSNITITWISFLHQILVPALLVWPSQAQVRSRMPFEFMKDFSKTRVVIDCTEFFIDRPGNKEEQYKTYSQYKSHNTFKCLVGVNANGAFTFISDLWAGNVSDRYITEHSGIIDLIEEDDEVMADRGFRIEDLLLEKGAVLVAPPFTRKWNNGKGKRLNVMEIRRTRAIAKVRIHVERAIQRLKIWKILKHQIPRNLKDVSSMIVKVVAALCNLRAPLFHSKL